MGMALERRLASKQILIFLFHLDPSPGIVRAKWWYQRKDDLFMNGNQAVSVNDLLSAVLFWFNQHQMKQDFPQIREGGKKSKKSQPSCIPGVLAAAFRSLLILYK